MVINKEEKEKAVKADWREAKRKLLAEYHRKWYAKFPRGYFGKKIREKMTGEEEESFKAQRRDFMRIPIQRVRQKIRRQKYKETYPLRCLFGERKEDIVLHYGWNDDRNPTYDYIAVLERNDWFDRSKEWRNRECNDPIMILEGKIEIEPYIS